jgi:hypothetical protein
MRKVILVSVIGFVGISTSFAADFWNWSWGSQATTTPPIKKIVVRQDGSAYDRSNGEELESQFMLWSQSMIYSRKNKKCYAYSITIQPGEELLLQCPNDQHYRVASHYEFGETRGEELSFLAQKGVAYGSGWDDYWDVSWTGPYLLFQAGNDLGQDTIFLMSYQWRNKKGKLLGEAPFVCFSVTVADGIEKSKYF